MESYFLSDIHLKSVNERSGQVLLRFLNDLLKKDPAQVQVFFLGDIFDLWVSDGRAFIKKYHAVVDIVRQLTRRGVQMYFFEGNHDLHIHPYWEDVLKVRVYDDPQYFHVGSWQVRLEHGDLINLNDKSYLRLRNFLRHPWVEKVGHTMPGDIWLKIGDLWSPRSRKKSADYGRRNEDVLRQMIHEHAERVYAEKPFDLIITGHMHVRDDYEFTVGTEQVRSINLGSWFEDIQVLRIQDKTIEWISLE